MSKSNLISETYECQSCKNHPEMNSYADLFVHLHTIHGIKEGAEGTSQVLMHADGPRQYSYTNEIKFGMVTLIQKLTFKRSKSSQMYE